MNKNFVIVFILWISCSISYATLFPTIEFQTLQERAYVPSANQAKILFICNTENLSSDTINTIPNILYTAHKLGYAFRQYPIKIIVVYSDIDISPEFLQTLKTFEEQHKWLFDFCYDPGRQITCLETEKIPALIITNKQNEICYCEEKVEEYRILRQYSQVALGQIKPEQVIQYQPNTYSSDWTLANTSANLNVQPPVTIPTQPQPPVTIPTQPQPPVTIPTQPQPPVAIPTQPQPPVAVPTQPQPPVTSISNISPSPITTVASFPISDSSTKPLGTLPKTWECVYAWEDAIFFGIADFLVCIIPILIWGWGFLFALAKSKQYSKMRWASLACLGFTLWYSMLFLIRIPLEITWLSTILYTIQNWAEIGYQTILPYHGDQAIQLGLSLMFVMGLFNKKKEE